MKRKALLKDGDKFVVLEESKFDAEAALQGALKRNAAVIPAADLELGKVLVVVRGGSCGSLQTSVVKSCMWAMRKAATICVEHSRLTLT